MSVTFAPGFISTGRFFIEALPETGDAVRFGPYEGYEAATAAYEALRPTFDADYVYGAFIEAESVTGALPSLNISNSNAVSVLMALDVPMDEESPYGYDLCGSEDAATFKARVLTALATDYDDEALPAVTTVLEGGATWVQGARPAQYVSDKLTALYAIAEAAEEYGVSVVWS